MNQNKWRKSLAFLLLLSIVLVGLGILAVLNKVGGYVGYLNISNVIITHKVDTDSLPPQQIPDKLNDTEQLYVWLEYERARKSDQLKIQCYFNKQQIINVPIQLTKRKGTRVFSLIRSDGSNLPFGEYTVIISTPTKEWYKKTFILEKKVLEKKHKPVQIKSTKKNKRNFNRGLRRNVDSAEKKNNRKKSRRSGRRSRR